jgi:ribosomal protein S27AE
MNYVAHCPSCGAQVLFRSAASVLAVCEYCQSTLLRHDMDLESLGKMATLLADASHLQLGVEGQYHGEHFAIIGRIQLRYELGVWNEWYVLFDSQREAWLSEASGNYVFTFPTPLTADVPAFADLRIDQRVRLLNQDFTVSNIETATCIAVAGELPMSVSAGYAAPVVDLSNNTHFASLDYSADKPLLYLGEEVTLSKLALTGLREGEQTAGMVVKNFNCPSCGAALQVHAKSILSVACGGCGSVIDVGNTQYKILAKYHSQVHYTPRLKLGSSGKFRGVQYQIIGYLRRRVTVDGLPYEWAEYLLYSDKASFRWLSEERGHWNFISPTTRKPSSSSGLSKPKVSFLGRNYTHFQNSTAVTTYVIGEFYWRVRANETVAISDFIAPPLMLSRELTANEVNWSIAEYVTPAEVANAFKPDEALMEPIGIAANQPSPHNATMRRYGNAFVIFMLILLVLQVGFIIAAQRTMVFHDVLNFESYTGRSVTTQSFEIKGGHAANLQLTNQANIDNNWLYLDMALVNVDTGQRYQFGRELSYYHGYDSDGAWTEGRAGDEVVLSSVPAGHYFMQVDADMAANSSPLTDTVTLVRDVPVWSNFWLTLVGLSIVPLIAWWRGSRFESQRWDESDYADSSDSGDNGGGD